MLFKKNETAENNDDPLGNLPSGINAYLGAVSTRSVRGQRKNRLKFKKGARSGDADDFDDEARQPE